jgi:outer membrane receptor protein involved in Fe transport
MAPASGVARLGAAARRARRLHIALVVSVLPAAAVAQEQGGEALTLPQVNIVGTTPMLGSGIDRGKVPGETHVLTGADVNRDGTPNLLRSLNDTVAGVTLDDAAANQFQPNLLYHGFQASPLQGNAQGLAVYVNGTRFNQAFGDTVDWDLLPDIAIDRVELVGSNPAFGLNALGGSVSVRLKNGFAYQGAEGDLWGGSFGRVTGEFQYGVQKDNVGAYVAGSATHADGWRQSQSSDLYNIYGDVGWRGDRGEVHLGIIGADTNLNGPGTAPVELIAVDRRAQFTAPNLISNKYALVSLNGTMDVTDHVSLQGNAYYGYLQQRVINGNVSDVSPCDNTPGFLCASDDVFATDRGGSPIPDFLSGGPYSQLDRQSTNTNRYGVSLQVTHKGDVFGRPNQLVAGASFDGADTMFSASTAIGGLTPLDRAFVGPGIVLDQADGSIAPVRVGVTNAYYGLFFTDTLDLTDRLAATVAGRFNAAQIDLDDRGGSAALGGAHAYNRFNPSAGLSYKIVPGLNIYGSYAEANRAPTPAELSCANAAAPCSLANFFVGDPDLKQVVAHTFEAGVRGDLHPYEGARLSYNLGLFHTNLDDDILFVNSAIQGRAFFQNVGTTRRQGADAGLRLATGRLVAWANYSYIDATFQNGFTVSSPDNPAAGADGSITVRSGDHIPGVPTHLIKIGVSYRLTDNWTVGATGVGASGQYLIGDEANLTPKTQGYFVVNLNSQYQITKNVQVFGLVQNLFDTEYYTFGTFSPTSSVPIAQAPGAANPRSYSAAPPLAGYGGIRVTF